MFFNVLLTELFDTASKGFLDTTAYTVKPVTGTKNPQMYVKVQNSLPRMAPSYSLDTLLQDATVEQAMERVFEIQFERIAKYYSIPFVDTAKAT